MPRRSPEQKRPSFVRISVRQCFDHKWILFDWTVFPLFLVLVDNFSRSSLLRSVDLLLCSFFYRGVLARFAFGSVANGVDVLERCEISLRSLK